MKSSIFSLLFLLFSGSLWASRDLFETRFFGPNRGNLRMFVHGASHGGPDAKALVLVLHGCGQTAATISRQSGWNKLADENNFIVVYPQQKRINNPSGCFNWFFGDDNLRGKGEVSSLADMIQHMMETYPIDPQKIFVVGFSAGAAMASSLMACYPEYIHAGAIFAGGPYGAVTNPFSGPRMMINPYDRTPDSWGQKVISQNPDYQGPYPKLIVVHGRNDWVVNFHNSMELVDQYCYLHHTAEDEKKTESAWKGFADIERTSYTGQKQESIVSYRIARLGHALAVHPGKAPNEGGKSALFAVKREFHMSWIIAGDFGLLK